MEISQVCHLHLSTRDDIMPILVVTPPLQHGRYKCSFCGKDTVKRSAVGIWNCSACRKTVAGGAWTVGTPSAAIVRRWALSDN